MPYAFTAPAPGWRTAAPFTVCSLVVHRPCPPFQVTVSRGCTPWWATHTPLACVLWDRSPHVSCGLSCRLHAWCQHAWHCVSCQVACMQAAAKGWRRHPAGTFSAFTLPRALRSKPLSAFKQALEGSGRGSDALCLPPLRSAPAQSPQDGQRCSASVQGSRSSSSGRRPLVRPAGASARAQMRRPATQPRSPPRPHSCKSARRSPTTTSWAARWAPPPPAPAPAAFVAHFRFSAAPPAHPLPPAPSKQVGRGSFALVLECTDNRTGAQLGRASACLPVFATPAAHKRRRCFLCSTADLMRTTHLPCRRAAGGQEAAQVQAQQAALPAGGGGGRRGADAADAQRFCPRLHPALPRRAAGQLVLLPDHRGTPVQGMVG